MGIVKTKRTEKVTFKNNPVTLIGRKVSVDHDAPFFSAVDRTLQFVDLEKYGFVNSSKTVRVITTFPSLNTSVCSLQIKKFNNDLAKKAGDITFIGISMDLPFAQEKFCEENEIRDITLLSDFRHASFGINYGVLIKELNLLARTAIIIDTNNIIRYFQIADEISNELDYDDILRNIDEVRDHPKLVSGNSIPSNCNQDSDNMKKLSENEIDEFQKHVVDWSLHNQKMILREIKFNDPFTAQLFTDMVNTVANEQNHHPTITLSYRTVTVTLTTHKVGGLSVNDFIMAHIVDELVE